MTVDVFEVYNDQANNSWLTFTLDVVDNEDLILWNILCYEAAVVINLNVMVDIDFYLLKVFKISVISLGEFNKRKQKIFS